MESQLLLVTVVLVAARLISGYSFMNCMEDAYSNRTSFKCIHRKNKTMSAYVDDLPRSALNLTISANPLKSVSNRSFAHLYNLQNLKMDHNGLIFIAPHAFQNLSQLKSLNLSCNNIAKLPASVFEDLKSLTTLLLFDNRLKQLPEGIFSPLGNLIVLKMRKNILANFSGIAKSVSHLQNLTLLDLCFNKLTSLQHSNVSLPKNLTTLYLCRNNLSILGCNHLFLQHIQLLDLSYNSKLPTEAFQGVDLSRVNYLRLSSTKVDVVRLLNISNVDAGHIDFTGTRLKNNNQLTELCRVLKKRMTHIKKMNLCGNGIVNLSENMLDDCPQISGPLNMSRNELKRTSCLQFLKKQTHVTALNVEHNHFNSLPSCQTSGKINLTNMVEISYRYNRILSVNSYAFYNTPNITTLKLNINTISFLHLNALKGLTRLTTLRLDNNLLTDLYHGTFEDQTELKVLNLRNNRISVIFNGTFHSQKSLTSLDLGGNKITHFEPSGLTGLESLSKFYLDGNNLKIIDPSLYNVLRDTLRVLDLQGNQIQFLSDTPFSPFMNLSKLYDLKLSGQQPHGLTTLPGKFFSGLYSLTSLYLTNNNIKQLTPDVFDDLKHLMFLSLDYCCVGVTQLQPGIFKNLKKLKKLSIESMVIQNFSTEVFENLTNLRQLQLNHNGMQSISVDALESLPNLNYLDIRDIPLICTCINSLLQNWTLKNPKVQVIYAYQLPCENDPKHRFHNFDTKVCYIDLGEYLFISTAIVTFLLTVTPLLYVKLFWKMKYGYYVFRSWFSEQWRRIRDEEENCKYDAFISYNSSDEQWVMDQLLPNLEGNGSSFKLCLHHRDFELGRDIVDNIVSAVYGSRKTICVVSRNFLRSEWCSLEIQLASYRLFDELRDVLLLVFLEPISERQLSSYHRMRKVMLKKTYLQWPGSDCTDPVQAQELFWNQLRRAMRTGSRIETDENDEKQRCLTLEKKEGEGFENDTSEENYYLLP